MHFFVKHGTHSTGGIHAAHTHAVENYKRRFFLSVLLTVPIFYLTPMINDSTGIGNAFNLEGSNYILLGLSAVVVFYGGSPFLWGMWKEMKFNVPGMMTLVTTAILVGFAYSAAVSLGFPGGVLYPQLVTLIDIMLLGRWVEMKSILGTGTTMQELTQLLPEFARRVHDEGYPEKVLLGDLKAGDMLVVKTGEKIPADGEIVHGNCYINESLLTGESIVVAKRVGDKVLAGSQNSEGSFGMRVTKTGNDTYVARLMHMVEEAQSSKSHTQGLADRAALWLTVLALSAGFLTQLGWMVFANESFDYATQRMVTVMVIACPHALGLAVPLVVAVSASIGARKGLLIRDRNAFEQVHNVQIIAFDKTGTLTEGAFKVTDILTFAKDVSADQILAYAASVEMQSDHPLAKSIVKSSKECWISEEFKSISGVGVQGKILGRKVAVVSPGYIRENGLKVDDAKVSELQLQGKTVVFLLINDEAKGALALTDYVKPESVQAIQTLKAMGIDCIMITGDEQKVAQGVAAELGITEVYGAMLPEQKAAKIKEIQARGVKIAMVGDGINDAPALAQADVGIAIGAGTDVATETADIVLVKSTPMDVVTLLSLAQKTYSKMSQNLAWATGYNVFAIPAAAGLFVHWDFVLTPAIAAVLMTSSTVLCAINARLLQRNTEAS